MTSIEQETGVSHPLESVANRMAELATKRMADLLGNMGWAKLCPAKEGPELRQRRLPSGSTESRFTGAARR